MPKCFRNIILSRKLYFIGRTHWNRHCSAILRRLLPKLEERKQSGTNGSVEGGTTESVTTIHSNSPSTLYDEHFVELKEIINSYQV